MSERRSRCSKQDCRVVDWDADVEAFASPVTSKLEDPHCDQHCGTNLGCFVRSSFFDRLRASDIDGEGGLRVESSGRPRASDPTRSCDDWSWKPPPVICFETASEEKRHAHVEAARVRAEKSSQSSRVATQGGVSQSTRARRLFPHEFFSWRRDRRAIFLLGLGLKTSRAGPAAKPLAPRG